MPSWTSPSHSPVRSVDFAIAIRGKPLTNRRIDHYALLGKYGDEEQQRVIAKRNSRLPRAKRHNTPARHISVTLTLEDFLC